MPLTPSWTEADSVADGTADSTADVLVAVSGATIEAPFGTATPALSMDAALLVDASCEAPLRAVMSFVTSASPPKEICEHRI